MENWKDLEFKSKNHEFFTSDSRKATGACVFVALRGASRDAHDFVNDLRKSNPQLLAVVAKDFYSQQDNKENLYPVEDTHIAHRELARIFREKSKAKIIAVGGSAGKTSTKEFLRQILQHDFKIVVTEKSQNGELGIPKTLESLRADTQVAIVEVGIDRPSDMQRHVAIVQPDIAILTSIGEEHLEQLIDLETVFREESILFEETWKRGGICFAPQADSFLRRHENRTHMVYAPDLPQSIDVSWSVNFENPLALRNVSLALKVAQFVGVDSAKIPQILNQLELPEGRGRVWMREHLKQTIIADHYNSNPSSLRAGFLHLKSMNDQSPLFLILGDMLELGPRSLQYHKELLHEALLLRPEGICLVGPLFGQAFVELSSQVNAQNVIFMKNSKEDSKELQKWSTHKGRFFFKASRGMALEEILKLFE